MKRLSALASIATFIVITLGMIVSLFGYGITKVLAATTTTTTVIGSNVPNGTNLGNGIVAFILPIIVMGLVVGLTAGLGIKGHSSALLMKIGLMAGGVLGMLSLTSTAASVIPFALPLVAAIYLITYLWKGV